MPTLEELRRPSETTLEMGRLFVNIYDAAGEERLEGLTAMEWPTGAPLPLPGEHLRVQGYDDLQVVRRLFHVRPRSNDLAVDLFVGYASID